MWAWWALVAELWALWAPGFWVALHPWRSRNGPGNELLGCDEDTKDATTQVPCALSAPCAFLQAIDLIDEAGSRVRLRHIQLPEEARDLDKELRQVTKDKDASVRWVHV